MGVQVPPPTPLVARVTRTIWCETPVEIWPLRFRRDLLPVWSRCRRANFVCGQPQCDYRRLLLSRVGVRDLDRPFAPCCQHRVSHWPASWRQDRRIVREKDISAVLADVVSQPRHVLVGDLLGRPPFLCRTIPTRPRSAQSSRPSRIGRTPFASAGTCDGQVGGRHGYRRISGPGFSAFVNERPPPQTPIRDPCCSDVGSVPPNRQWWYISRYEIHPEPR